MLIGTLPGRLALAGITLKLLCRGYRALTSTEPTVVALLDSLGGLALVALAICLVYRLIPRARRRLLWPVRRKLIVSYIFIGVVPAALIVSFFVVSGLILFLSVASFLVQNSLGTVANEAVYLARLTAIEIQRGPGPAGAAAILAQREAALASRYPGASIALVPTVAGRPCVGSPSTAGLDRRVPALVVATRPGDAPTSAAPRAPVPPATALTPVAVGPWEHVGPPRLLPSWVSCGGFAGVVAEIAAADSRAAGGQPEAAPALLIMRGVGLPDTEPPGFAIIVDIPKNEAVDDILREETKVKIGAVSATLDDGLRARLSRSGAAARDLLTSPPPEASSGKHRIPWVSLGQSSDWATGLPVSTTVAIGVNIADLYDRLSPGRVGRVNFPVMVLVVLLLIALLFLVIEAAALVMGLALARSITGSVHELFSGTERVRRGDFSHRVEVATNDQLGELAASFNDMTASIEDLLRQAEEKKRLEEELRIARDIQMSLLPRGEVSVPGLSISALCVPAREVGGDYYDFLPLDDHRFGVLIADVSGKGTSAALYMAELKGLILSLSRTSPSPRQLLVSANQIISEHLDSRSFITMSYAVVDLAARTMTYARAGHTPLLYRPANGSDEGRVRVLIPDGLVLGLRIDEGELFERLLEEVTVPLDRGDVLLFFTDGISEAMNGESDLFGEERLSALLAKHGHLPVDQLRERILREIEAFVAGAPQHDDMTMILLRFDDFIPGGIRRDLANGHA